MTRLLMQEIRSPDRAPRHVILDTQLIVRASSAGRVKGSGGHTEEGRAWIDGH